MPKRIHRAQRVECRSLAGAVVVAGSSTGTSDSDGRHAERAGRAAVCWEWPLGVRDWV